jgi:hypothetical protein
VTFDLTRLLAEISAAAGIEDVIDLVLRDAEAVAALPEREREHANNQIADAIREREK